MLVGIHDVIIQSKFGFNILRSFRSTGGRNFHFPIDFAGHRYNSAAATAQPVMHAFFFCFNSVEGCDVKWFVNLPHTVSRDCEAAKASEVTPDFIGPEIWPPNRLT